MRPIDADALEEMFKTQYGCETCDNYEGIRCRACHCDDALGIIDSAPTLDVQPVRRGEWEELVWDDEYDKRKRRSYRCRRCYKQNAVRSNFCQHCGADMRMVSE